MALIKTVSCKLNTDLEQVNALRQTFEAFAHACNDVLGVSRENHTSNKVKLQHLCYRDIKRKHSLVANLAIRAIARVAESRKHKSRKTRTFQPTSVSYDQRTFTYIPDKEMVSLSTIKGRIKIPLCLGNYQRHLLKGQKVTSATVVYRGNTRQSGFYINIILSVPVPTPKGTRTIGIDLGINNLATTSNGLRFSGKEAMHIRWHFVDLRASLQAKGTKGAIKLLKQLSGKESRIIRQINHIISKRIVDSATSENILIMEDLKHIRETAKIRKRQKFIYHSWPFAQLQKFIEYKALAKGIAVAFIDPAYTSQTCSRCGALGKRNRHSFSCSCGYRNHSDFNASYNLSLRGNALSDGLCNQAQNQHPLVVEIPVS
jgi:IS605 OrfB family transposase